jgi:subtilase family serine protease
VDLWVDSKPHGIKTPVALDNGQELKVVFSNVKLTKGLHLIQVYLDPESKISEIDKTNNNYGDTRACN